MIAKKELIVKTNKIVEASYRLTLNEQRIILYAICRCREEQKGLFPNHPLTITAEAFSKQFPSVGKKNVYGQLKDALETLYERSISYTDIDEATQHSRLNKTRWIAKASYIDGAGHLQVIFTPDIIEQITRLEQEFTTYQLEKVAHMTSAHAIRIYEMLAQYLTVGSRELNLAWLRDALQISDDEYKLTGDFKKWVIDVAVTQINKHSDLIVSYKPQKTGRAITGFLFKIKRKGLDKSQKKSPAAIEKARDQIEREELETFGQQRLIDAEEF
jgi:plasmid replication initiation protein